MRIDKRFIKILITVMLFNFSLDLMAESFASISYLSESKLENSTSVATKLFQDCDDARTSSCSSTMFIAIFNLFKYFPERAIRNQSDNFSEALYSITLEVPKPPPRFHYM